MDEKVSRSVSWSPAGFRRLEDLYEPLRRFAGVIGRFDVEPDDLVQEAYARVLRRPEAEILDLGPYLRRTIANLATTERRTRGRRAELRAGMQAVVVDDDDYPSDLADLLRVPPKVRALLFLVDVEGEAIADAASTVDMTPAAARVALVRARRRLRKELSMETRGE